MTAKYLVPHPNRPSPGLIQFYKNSRMIHKAKIKASNNPEVIELAELWIKRIDTIIKDLKQKRRSITMNREELEQLTKVELNIMLDNVPGSGGALQKAELKHTTKDVLIDSIIAATEKSFQRPDEKKESGPRTAKKVDFIVWATANRPLTTKQVSDLSLQVFEKAISRGDVAWELKKAERKGIVVKRQKSDAGNTFFIEQMNDFRLDNPFIENPPEIDWSVLDVKEEAEADVKIVE